MVSVVGDMSDTAVYTPDASVTGNGQVVVNDDGGGSSATIIFTGLEPVDITAMA